MSQTKPLSLYDRVYQRVAAEVNNDEEFCTYLADICTDHNTHSDDLRDIIDTMFKTNHSNMSERRRQHLIYAILDMIETDQEKTKTNSQTDDQMDEELELNEKVERDGECKLCGSNQKITSMIETEEQKFPII